MTPVALPSAFGVSSSIGSPRKRRSLTMRRNRFETEAALADVLVTIDAAAERFLRIVQMKGLQPLESHEPAELLEGGRVAAK